MGRVHQYDLNIIGKSKTIKEYEDEIRSLNNRIKNFEHEIERFRKEEENNKKILIYEINAIREKLNTAQLQKNELISAFEDLSEVFQSFSLKI